MLQTTIQNNRLREYERYQEYQRFEYDRARTDEVTDMSERIAAPMRNTFDYEMRSDGELWFQGEPLGHIFDDGIAVAEELARENPQFTTELIRRHLERQEYNDMRKLALGGDDDPDLLVVLSPIPDEVLEGFRLNAYDTKRKKTLVRIFQKTDFGIEATSLSVDLSDRDGLNAIAQLFGKTIAPEATSEDILAMRFLGYAEEYGEDAVKTLRTAYDTALSEKFSGEWYAGRQPSDVLDAKAFIEQQPDLIEKHMEEIAMIKKRHTGNEREKKLEDARYNFAAALTRRMRGDSDSSSLSEAGDVARANGESYDGDCPTRITDTTAKQSLSELGMGKDEHLRCVTCPICGSKGVDGIVSGNTITCSKKGCTVDRSTGEVLRGPGGKRKKVAKEETATTSAKKQARQRDAKAVFGGHVEERTTYSVGSAESVVYDRRTGTAIAKKTRKGYASL